eukprot:9655977-Lingulodinium_polyedra.AAC.1
MNFLQALAVTSTLWRTILREGTMLPNSSTSRTQRPRSVWPRRHGAESLCNFRLDLGSTTAAD